MANAANEAQRLLKWRRTQRMLALWSCFIAGTGLGFYAKHAFGLGNYAPPSFGFLMVLIVPPIARQLGYRWLGNPPGKAPRKI